MLPQSGLPARAGRARAPPRRDAAPPLRAPGTAPTCPGGAQDRGPQLRPRGSGRILFRGRPSGPGDSGPPRPGSRWLAAESCAATGRTAVPRSRLAEDSGEGRPRPQRGPPVGTLTALTWGAAEKRRELRGHQYPGQIRI